MSREGSASVSGTLASRRLELLVVLGILILDQLTKALVRGRLVLYESIEVIPGVLDLTRVHNTGAAFGMLNTVDLPFKAVLLTVIALAAVAGIAWYTLSVPLADTLTRLGIAAIAGGAIGNIIDRALFGFVLDFVDAYWGGWHFWAFNVADAAITVGVMLMLLDLVKVGRRASHPV